AELVDDRKHARHRRVDEGDLRIGLRTEIGCRAGEQLGFADDLGVDLQTQHNLPTAGSPFDQAHARPPLAGTAGAAVKSAAPPTPRAPFSTVSSSKARPIPCRPKGSPSSPRPAGT